jgi:phosphate transport system substrate-binding protein
MLHVPGFPRLRSLAIGKVQWAAACATCLLWGSVAAQLEVDPRLPEYRKASGVSGVVKSVGSDTMNNLMTMWLEGFLKLYPNVQVEVEGKGSSTAPPALVAGTATFGPMSRPMKAREQEEFEDGFGYKATGLAVAVDMLAVYVHRDNPIAERGLTLEQLDAVFSKTRRGGAKTEARTWGDLGLTGEWAREPISLFGRNSASGTYGYFKEKALFGGDFKDEVKEQPGSSSVVQGVASDRFAIGYAGIGYLTADVVVVPLARDDDDEFHPLDPDDVGRYPLSRVLYVYVNHRPNGQLDPLRRELLRYVFSRPGQEVVLKDGYLPLRFPVAQRELGRIGIEVEPAVPDRSAVRDAGPVESRRR